MRLSGVLQLELPVRFRILPIVKTKNTSVRNANANDAAPKHFDDTHLIPNVVERQFTI
jgi:hypothetical protein